MANFPGATPTFTGFTSSHTLAQDVHASQHNIEQGEIVALANKIGTGASTPTSGLLLRGNGTGTSVWAQANLTSDVTGVLPQANGGTGTTLATGTGKAVYDTSPTISGAQLTSSPTLTTPTIASFINSVHNHESNNGGGTLNATNALQSGSVSYTNLLSTIFSGQVISYNTGGTFFYTNLGGIKLFWGQASSISITTTGVGTGTVTFPASFFSTTQTVLMTPQPGGDVKATVGVNAISSSTLNIYAWNTGGTTSTATPFVFVVGT